MVSLVEEMIMNPDAVPNCHGMRGWRHYRVEYGFECGCPEGVIWLPPDVSCHDLEKLLSKYQRQWEPNADAITTVPK